jgi:hypothetical protein
LSIDSWHHIYKIYIWKKDNTYLTANKSKFILKNLLWVKVYLREFLRKEKRKEMLVSFLNYKIMKKNHTKTLLI